MGERHRRYTFGKEETQTLASVHHEENDRSSLSDTIRSDFCDERPMWPFTSYAPHGKFMTATGLDLSFEELRYEEMRLIKVEHTSREDVIARTNSLLEQARHSLQQYYDANCSGDGGKAGRQVQLLRRSFGGDNAGFGSTSQYSGPYGKGAVFFGQKQQLNGSSPAFGTVMETSQMSQSSCNDHFDTQRQESMPASSFPIPSRTEPMTASNNANPPHEQGEIDDKDNPWIAAEFTYIPDSAPPEKYIH